MNSLVLLLLLSRVPSTQGFTGYAQASGYFKKDARPTLYQPLNLLDGRASTSWCTSTADSLDDAVFIGFSDDVVVSEVTITTGNNFSTQTFRDFGRASKISIHSGTESESFALDDSPKPQTLKLSKPLKGRRFRIEVLDQYPTEDPEQPVCLTDVILSAPEGPLSGSWMTTRLKFDRDRSPILGVWYAGPDKYPNEFLAFFVDGTWLWSFEPTDDGAAKPKTLRGSYEVTGQKLTLAVGDAKFEGAVTLPPRAHRGRSSGRISLTGALPAGFPASVRDAP